MDDFMKELGIFYQKILSANGRFKDKLSVKTFILTLSLRTFETKH
jgi:hypothetical protein